VNTWSVYNTLLEQQHTADKITSIDIHHIYVPTGDVFTYADGETPCTPPAEACSSASHGCHTGGSDDHAHDDNSTSTTTGDDDGHRRRRRRTRRGRALATSTTANTTTVQDSVGSSSSRWWKWEWDWLIDSDDGGGGGGMRKWFRHQLPRMPRSRSKKTTTKGAVGGEEDEDEGGRGGGGGVRRKRKRRRLAASSGASTGTCSTYESEATSESPVDQVAKTAAATIMMAIAAGSMSVAVVFLLMGKSVCLSV